MLMGVHFFLAIIDVVLYCTFEINDWNYPHLTVPQGSGNN
jgi:hypothetical protein